MSEEQGIDREYIGDSVYAEIHNGMLKLTTNNGYGDSNTIYLDDAVLDAMMSYLRRHDWRVGV